MRTLIFSSLIAVALSGCATFRSSNIVRDFCELAPNMRAHRNDTWGTQERIDVYREFYRKRCQGNQYKW